MDSGCSLLADVMGHGTTGNPYQTLPHSQQPCPVRWLWPGEVIWKQLMNLYTATSPVLSALLEFAQV